MRKGLSSSHSSLYPTIDELTVCIEQQFSIANLGPGKRSNSGQTNMVVIYNDYVARVHNPEHDYRTQEYFELEIGVLKAAHEQGIGVPEVVGMFSWSLGSAMLFKRFQGRARDPGAANIQVVAEAVAKIHSLRGVFVGEAAVARVRRIRGARESPSRAQVLAAAPTVIQAMLKHMPFGKDDSNRYAALMTRLVDICGEVAVDGSLLPSGIVHGDLNSGNWLWRDNSDEYCLLDWDFFSYDHFLKDLSYLLLSWCCDGPRWLFPRALKLIRSYQHFRALSQEETLRLPDSVALAWLKTCVFMFSESQWKMPHAKLLAQNLYDTLSSMCDQTGELNFHTAFAVSEAPAFSLQVKSFFVSWTGSVTLAFCGWPQSVLRLKERITIRGGENAGSRWPKVTLGQRKEALSLTREQVRRIQETPVQCATLRVTSVTLATFTDARLVNNRHECAFALGEPEDASGEDPMFTEATKRVLAESQEEAYLDKVNMKPKPLKCARDQTLVAFLRNQQNAQQILAQIQEFTRTWSEHFDFFPERSLHVTLTALPH